MNEGFENWTLKVSSICAGFEATTGEGGEEREVSVVTNLYTDSTLLVGHPDPYLVRFQVRQPSITSIQHSQHITNRLHVNFYLWILTPHRSNYLKGNKSKTRFYHWRPTRGASKGKLAYCIGQKIIEHPPEPTLVRKDVNQT